MSCWTESVVMLVAPWRSGRRSCGGVCDGDRRPDPERCTCGSGSPEQVSQGLRVTDGHGRRVKMIDALPASVPCRLPPVVCAPHPSLPVVLPGDHPDPTGPGATRLDEGEYETLAVGPADIDTGAV